MDRENWSVAHAYERYIGRWSRRLAPEFLAWLGAPARLAWLDVGCGTGALSASIAGSCTPSRLISLDRSFPYVAGARDALTRSMSHFLAADACDLPLRDAHVDVAVSALVLNFVSEPQRMIEEMQRVTRARGHVAVYVWDYAGRMEPIRRFWDAAAELNRAAREVDEATRFPLCQPDALEELFRNRGLTEVQVQGIEVPTVFRDFEDYWSPFLGGQGPAPGYLVSLEEGERSQLRALLEARLPREADGSIHLVARAWAARVRAADHAVHEL